MYPLIYQLFTYYKFIELKFNLNICSCNVNLYFSIILYKLWNYPYKETLFLHTPLPAANLKCSLWLFLLNPPET